VPPLTRPIEMEHTENAWDLKPAAILVRSSTAKIMRGSGAAGSQAVDGHFLQRLLKVRPLGMRRLQLFKQLPLSAEHAVLEPPCSRIFPLPQCNSSDRPHLRQMQSEFPPSL